jgi:putative intracellular protease/amidase
VWLEELAQAFFALREAGATLVLATPNGGRVPLDPASCTDPWLSELGRRLLDDFEAKQMLEESRRLADVDGDSLDALYIVGGAGAMADLPSNPALAALLTTLLRRQQPVAAVCHGVAGLASAKSAQGAALIAGKRVTCFSNVEEEQVGYGAYLPQLPENLLRSLGAVYSSADPWVEHVVVDGLLLTGQNPASAGPLARQLAAVLGARQVNAVKPS